MPPTGTSFYMYREIKFIGIISRTGVVLVALVKIEDCVLISFVVKLKYCFPVLEIW